jgi:hypothetical protein
LHLDFDFADEDAEAQARDQNKGDPVSELLTQRYPRLDDTLARLYGITPFGQEPKIISPKPSIFA